MLTHADEIDDDGMYLFRHMLAPKVLLDMCPHTTICVSSRYYLCPHAACVSMEVQHVSAYMPVEVHAV
jgi:hypothetical protein